MLNRVDSSDKQPQLYVNKICKTFLEVIQSDDFIKWINIILKEKKFGRQYYLGLFEKIKNNQQLNEKEKEDVISFLEDEKVYKIWNKILNNLKASKEIKSTDYGISWDDLIKELFSDRWFFLIKKEIYAVLWQDLEELEKYYIVAKLKIEWKEKIVKVDKENLRVNSINWREIVSTNWVRVKVNTLWDIWEFVDWKYKWEQFFTWESAVRESIKQWKKMFWINEFKSLISSMRYEKFLEKYNVKFSGYRDINGSFKFINNECCFWSKNSKDDDESSWYVSFRISNFNMNRCNSRIAFPVRCYQ